MFIGHFGLSFAAKRATPRVSLAVLFTAAAFADVLWPVLVALGYEHVRIDPGNTAFTPLDFVSYPYSHSLLTLIVWGAAFAVVYRAITAENGRTFAVLTSLVVSHWVLDFMTHRPDMPLYPGGPKLGLGLWNSLVGTVAIEVPLFALGVWIYTNATRPRDKTGRWAFVGLIVLLVVSYIANIFSGPPPSVQALYVAALVGTGVLLVWSGWADRHRAAQSA
jgi:membrane-bound metal-dependent hydrolase YbcI (DUF457 family)